MCSRAVRPRYGSLAKELALPLRESRASSPRSARVGGWATVDRREVYLDDVRQAPDGWVRTRTPKETIESSPRTPCTSTPSGSASSRPIRPLPARSPGVTTRSGPRPATISSCASTCGRTGSPPGCGSPRAERLRRRHRERVRLDLDHEHRQRDAPPGRPFFGQDRRPHHGIRLDRLVDARSRPATGPSGSTASPASRESSTASTRTRTRSSNAFLSATPTPPGPTDTSTTPAGTCGRAKRATPCPRSTRGRIE
jgi:hypothetical protein